MGLFWIIWVSLNPMTSVLIRDRRCHMMTEAETGMMRPQAQGRWSPRSWQGPAWGPLEGTAVTLARDLALGVAVRT